MASPSILKGNSPELKKLKETQDAMIMARDLLTSKIISENEFEKLAEAVDVEEGAPLLAEWEQERENLLSLGNKYEAESFSEQNAVPTFSSPNQSQNDSQMVYTGRGSPISMGLLEQEANELAAEQDFYRRIAEAGNFFAVFIS